MRTDGSPRVPADVRRQGSGLGVIPFVTAGYPSLASTSGLLPRLAAAGARVIEVGIPFSDPIADGPVIAESMHRALAAGCTPFKVFEAVRAARAGVDASLAAMVSHSIVARIGMASFVGQAREAGFDAMIVPDVDLDDAPALRTSCDANGMALTLLVAPTSPVERIRRITELCSGFVYALARVGITGERTDLPDIAPLVARVRACTERPVAVGFGISTPEHVRAVLQHADGAIVGSALVRRMREAVDAGRPAEDAAERLVASLAAAVRQ